ncbi:unnamed protein product [Thelazia callipaeda]|uniref:PABS domain-containing protein n=1 Tax=Thelazia callipaeda TaxID=103827 RepID=A0A0N5CKW8_THECL|nr:unnamed protein product [Thelazia callipaeda]
MDFIDGWFSELSPDELASENGKNLGLRDNPWHGQMFSLRVKKVLYHARSKYQDVLVFESSTYGKVLALDGIIQCSERDEFAYQEMLAHLVLVVGGGDGAILREVLKHSTVESVTLCEIDEMVVDVSKKHLPQMSVAFGDPKCNVIYCNGAEYIKKHKDEFDVIITDSSDPIGPAKELFGKNYYMLMKEALKEDGVFSSQGKCMQSIIFSSINDFFNNLNNISCPWLDLQLIRGLFKLAKNLFPHVAYAIGSVPTYPCGQIGYLIGSKNGNHDVTVPLRVLSDSDVRSMNLKYYNSDVHRAAFVLPQFIKEVVLSFVLYIHVN